MRKPLSRTPTATEYERAVGRAEAVFAKNKSRMWVLKILREYLRDEIERSDNEPELPL